MKYAVREVVLWDNEGTVHQRYSLYVDDCFPEDLDYKSLKKIASVVNKFIEKKEAEK